jgi:hypothetical protein
VVHGCTRLAVKLDFIAGLLLKAVEASGTKDFRGVQANVGEVLAWRNLFWGLSDAMVRDPRPWIGEYLLPNMDPGSAYHVIATIAYSKIKYLIEQTVASGLIYLNSHARDFANEDIGRISTGIFVDPMATLRRTASSSASCSGTHWEVSSAAGTNFMKSTTRDRPKRFAGIAFSVRRHPERRIDSRALQNSVWRNTTSMAGRLRILPIPGR